MKTCCESANFNCNQGRSCPLITANSDDTSRDMPIMFVYGAFEWLQDMFYAGIQLVGAVILGAVGIGFLAYGLRGWL